MNKLKELSDKFIDSVQNLTVDFPLTKSNSFVKYASAGLLAMTLSTGAFAHNNIPFVQDGSLEDTLAKELVQEITQKAGVMELTAEELSNIANGGPGGIFQLPDENLLVITKNFSIGRAPSDISNKMNEYYKSINRHKSDQPFGSLSKKEGFFSNHSTINTLNITDNYFDNNNPETIAKYPTLKKYQNDFIAAHELHHVYNSQVEMHLEHSDGTKTINPVVKSESMSDIFGAIFVAKANNLSLMDMNNLLDDLSNYRNEGAKHGDLFHYTSYSLDTFKNILNDDPSIFHDLKKLDLLELDKKVADLSTDLFNDLDNKYSERLDNENKDFKFETVKDQLKEIQSYEPDSKVVSKVSNKLKSS